MTTDTATKGDVSAAKKAEPKPAPKPKAMRVGSKDFVLGTTILSMLKDDDGKPYGATNNPKREGSKAAARFAKYLDGKTLEENLAQKDGPNAADIKNDFSQFITLKAA